MARRRADAAERDRGSLLAVQVLAGLGYFVAFSQWRQRPGPELASWALWAGAAVALAGMALRVWSIVTLGRWFTVRVRVSEDQPVVDSGPYRLVRHPSYAGALVAALGIGISLRYALAPLFTVLPQLVGLLIRVRVEEQALLEAIGEPYRAYRMRTKRLIPYVW